MKRLITIVLSVTLFLLFSFAVVGCNGASVNGRYYLYEFGSLDKNQYIELKGGKWSNDDGESGKYKLDGENITFYAEFMGEEEEMFSGAVVDGKLSVKVMGATMTYYKEGKEPSDGDNSGTGSGSGSSSGSGTPSTEHKHSFSKEWTYTDEYHWHRAICQHEDKTSDSAKHSMKGNECSVCGYKYEPTQGLSFEPNIDDTAYLVKGIGEASEESFIKIPQSYNNKPVVAIEEDAFKGNTRLLSVMIPSSIMAINDGAFSGCVNLMEIYNMSAIELTAGKGGGGDVALYAIDIYKTLDQPSKLEVKNEYVFYNGEKENVLMVYLGNDTSLYLPDSCRNGEYKIKNRLFYEGNITSVELGEQTVEVGEYAFSDCGFLREVTLGKGLKQIGEYAFSGTAIQSITIPARVNYIGKYAFADCANLSEVYFKNPAGWGYYYTGTNNEIDQEALSDPATAAKYLTDDYNYIYCTHSWQRDETVENPNCEHNFEEWEIGDDYHQSECVECGYIYKSEHTAKVEYIYDEESHWHECICGKQMDEKIEHTTQSKYSSDENYHWHECICGKQMDEKIEHTAKSEYSFNKSSHWHECETCGAEFNKKPHDLGLDGICKKCKQYMLYTITEDEEYIYFGEYPQSRMTETSLVAMLGMEAGTLPTSENKQKWTDYGYYNSGKVQSYMWYIDIEYNEERYRGVYFTGYRPYRTTLYSNYYDSHSYQEHSGYKKGKTYWFKWEPIKWSILEQENGVAFLMANNLLDGQHYYRTNEGTRSINGKTVYPNNYKESDIRSWLNETFYNQAFNKNMQDIIEITEVDNSLGSTCDSSNDYICEKTKDKIFLLSNKEFTTKSGLFRRDSYFFRMSAYAMCQGVGSPDRTGQVAGDWWLRSPANNGNAWHVYPSDSTSRYIYNGTDRVDDIQGVVPALKIKL